MAGPDPETVFQSILESAGAYLPAESRALLVKAYDFSKKAHEQQLRAGGDLYITHPLAVAKTLSELRLDLPTLAAGLLHDVLEDTPATGEQLRGEFGEEVARLVEGVTKIDALEAQTAERPQDASALDLLQQAENWRKMIIATAHDLRVILLKLADRKHNMETLEFLPPEKRRKIAEETLALYVPLAQRLGMYQLKNALADLALKFSEPGTYAQLDEKMKARAREREVSLVRCISTIENTLLPLAIPYKVFGRPKNLYSVYSKMKRQGKPLEDIQDLLAVRLITDTVEHCYGLLGVIHAQFEQVPGSFTDYIAIPKNNLYQSLHTTIKVAEGDSVEIQIRSEEMHRIAEYGVAAHWRYKLDTQAMRPGPGKDSFEARLDWLKQVLEWQQETKNPREFLDSLKTELEFDQVFVFTPKGEVKKLPLGSTPVDFAYAVHTDLGHECVGAKVNDKMVRLDYKLQSGDRCQIQTRKGQHPHKDWLEFVRTPRARSKIRKYFRETG